MTYDKNYISSSSYKKNILHLSSDWYNHIFFFCALFCDFITFLPFSHQVILPRGLNSWALALAAFFLEKCSQSSTCCHLCKLCPSFSYHCMCSCCMPLVTVRLFATNPESKLEFFQDLVLTLHITPHISCLLFLKVIQGAN